MRDHPTLFEVPEDWWVRRRCVVCGCALNRLHPHIYVVQRQWWVKIGATNNLRRRINELSRPAWRQHVLYPPSMDWTEPLTTLAVIIGGGYIEHDLHQRFKEQHVVGEWFLPTGNMTEWLEEVSK